jgi:hypothetical protein
LARDSSQLSAAGSHHHQNSGAELEKAESTKRGKRVKNQEIKGGAGTQAKRRGGPANGGEGETKKIGEEEEGTGRNR